MHAMNPVAPHNPPPLSVQSRSNGHPTPPPSALSVSHRPLSPRTRSLPVPVTVTPLSSPHRRPLRSTAPMASPDSAPPARGLAAAELSDAVDFDAILSPDGDLSVVGFGSLLSEKSARSTFPGLKNFRVAALRGFRRVFAHVAPIFFERGIANWETREVSSLSVEPCEGEVLLVTVFEIQRDEIPAFIEREHEFRFLTVVPETLDGIPFDHPAVVCARYSDEEYFQIRCKGDKEIYFQRYGRFNINKIWRDDILPCRIYLRHCVLAAKSLGDEVYSNFLHHTFINDRKTTIHDYLATDGSGIMEEEPTGPLRSRYGG